MTFIQDEVVEQIPELYIDQVQGTLGQEAVEMEEEMALFAQAQEELEVINSHISAFRRGEVNMREMVSGMYDSLEPYADENGRLAIDRL